METKETVSCCPDRRTAARALGHGITVGAAALPATACATLGPQGEAITQPASEGSFYPGQQMRLLGVAYGKTHVTQ